MVKKDKSCALLALTTAALSLPGMAPHQAQAQAVPTGFTTSYRYTEYTEENQPASFFGSEPFRDETPRYEIKVHQLHINGPIRKNTGLTLSMNTETMTGASPWYVRQGPGNTAIQVMSGASIEEKRDELMLGLDFYQESAKTAVGFSYSTENDYDSLSMSLGSTNWYNDNNTTVDLGFSAAIDSIEPTQQAGITRIESENKRSLSGSAGFTQVINKDLVIGSSAALSYYGGYLSDPYKQASVGGVYIQDSRPSDKQQISLNLQARQFVAPMNAALHADYRFFSNTWGVTSNTVRLAWYQNFGEHFQLVPQVRMYQQTAANFYRNYYINERADGFYSSDYRLSAFRAVSFKLRSSLLFDFGKFHLSYEYYNSSRLGDGIQDSNPGLVDFSSITAGFDIAW